MPRGSESLSGLYRRGLQTSVRNNATAYAYSVTITGTLAVLSSQHGTPAVFDVFVFLAGAVTGFVAVELAASRLFRDRMRGEPAEVVAIGSSLAYISGGLALGGAALSGEIVESGVVWPLGSFVATLTYLLLAGVEVVLAERAVPG